MNDLQKEVNDVFLAAFGETPLGQRLDDIHDESLELSRYVNLRNIEEEAGDLMASAIQLCNECGWDAASYKSLGRKVKVALLGGAFNPPTWATFRWPSTCSMPAARLMKYG